jgi:membrane-associated protein
MSPDHITQLIIEYRYWMLILLAFIEGPVVSFTGGFLASLGYFNPFAVLGIMVGKDIAVDAVCYAIGHFGNRGSIVKRYGKKIGIHDEHWEKVEELWDKHPWKTMFISKIAYGLSLPFLIFAGLSHMSYKRFWFYAVQISLLQYGLLMVLGYYFGSSFAFIKNTIDIVSIAVAIISVVCVAYYLFATFMRRKLLRDQEKN